jgi:hypothetical protein
MKKLLLFIVLGTAALTCAMAQSEGPLLERQDISKIVHVFPNPAVDFVNVRVETSKSENLKITLHNIIGNEMRVESEIVDEHEVRIHVKDLSTGYYLLAIKDPENDLRLVYKILKK